jgi:hypothetical protein
LAAAGTLDELRGPDADASLEDIFLEITGGTEDEDVAAFLDE